MQEKLAETNIPETFWDLEWDDYTCSDSLRAKLKEYLDIAEYAKNLGMGFNLAGRSMGAGKTAAAVLLAKGLLKKNIKVRYITFSDLLSALRLNEPKQPEDDNDDLREPEWALHHPTALRRLFEEHEAAQRRLTEQREAARRHREERKRERQSLEAGSVLVIDGIRPPVSEDQAKLNEFTFVHLAKHRVAWAQPTITVSNVNDDDLWRYYKQLTVHLAPYQFDAFPTPEEAAKAAIRPGALRTPSEARS